MSDDSCSDSEMFEAIRSSGTVPYLFEPMDNLGDTDNNGDNGNNGEPVSFQYMVEKCIKY